ncbi:hypothetical protein JVU11DRAFT_2970 [Chiua virens]|nr:hypothetical protein JVU11DRAFT_2970 [Chiua virens]
MAQVISFLDVCLFGAGIYLVKRALDSRHSSLLPPGPSGWPVIGNFFELSSDKNWEDFAALGKKYGNIIFAFTGCLGYPESHCNF